MKLTGYSIVYRPKLDGELIFYHDTLWDGSEAKALVFESRDEALGVLASLALEEIEEPQVVEVTLNTKGFKGE